MRNFRPGISNGRVAVYGEESLVCAAVITELLERGHDVTLVVPEPGPVAPGSAVLHVSDRTDADDVARVAAEHDAVVCAIEPPTAQTSASSYLQAVATLAENVATRRLLVLGDAGVLEIAPGLRMLDTATYPQSRLGAALASATALEYLRSTGALLDWLYVAPAAFVDDRPRTGTYRTGGETVIGDQIGAADLAVALVDELERAGRHRTVVSYAH